MACLDFDPNDYAWEMRTDRLVDELNRRGCADGVVDFDGVVDAIRRAWKDDDKAGFERALRELEPAGRRRAREERQRVLYAQVKLSFTEPADA